MRYATDEERQRGVASDVVYLDGNGKFLGKGLPPVTRTFEMGLNYGSKTVLDAGTNERWVKSLDTLPETC